MKPSLNLGRCTTNARPGTSSRGGVITLLILPLTACWSNQPILAAIGTALALHPFTIHYTLETRILLRRLTPGRRVIPLFSLSQRVGPISHIWMQPECTSPSSLHHPLYIGDENLFRRLTPGRRVIPFFSLSFTVCWSKQLYLDATGVY
jgi:hypothetical protein